MRKFVNATYMTLDGDISNMADWHFDYLGDQAMAAARAQLFSSDALVMGRETYESFAEAWSARSDDFADRINAMPKYVASTTLTEPAWHNTTVLNGDVVAQVRALKEQPGENILQYGFGSVTQLLLDHDLVDEVRIWLHPVLSGKAKQNELLYRHAVQTRFTLNDIETHDTGMIILSYTPAKRDSRTQA
jgi:dihydrofolate reductase